MRKVLSGLFTLTIMVLATLSGQQASAAEVNVYSAREENLIKPLLDRFSDETGIRVNLITAGADELTTRMELEGANSPADVLLTVDVGRLWRAKEADLLQSVDSDVLMRQVPSQYRDSDNQWFAASLRSRVIVYDKERVDPSELSTYEALADPKWRGDICVRSSSNIYNQSLVASLVSHNGLDDTQQWAQSLVENFARSPQGGDRDQIAAVAIGQCQLALVNTYYFAGMINSTMDDQREQASRVAVFWPNQEGRGAHINISGAAVARHAPNRQEAVQLMEYLVSDEAQEWYAETNNEYPVREGVPVSDTLASWGAFKADDLALEQLGIHNAEAVRLMDRAGWR
ncbi:iron deficiency-induced protein A [Pseudohongiella nitratireducens]|jgi:iron(III) transport system substrate-binding protein|uniref:Iron deficiency-induced protein A n=1 Tax=Pseudohongiella nitratireducens TaxID=1768907 RepID=A0A917LS24_9GAMM|nr:Fe(3+) ABC transporter substrate-binding protein [Pseudohongiella nitratireducens]GGG52316.1 iron deficiency-induced protein A [Pseudohongiella nitratireducens]